MKAATTSSISFVITAIYTYTFGNAVYRVFEVTEPNARIALRENMTWVQVIFMIVCITMALRFFFGNNSYVEHLFRTRLTPWRRLYHLSVIVLQSLILLGSSYLITNPHEFAVWIAALFATEVVWYTGCLLFMRDAIRKDNRLNRSLLVNEAGNLAMALVAGVTATHWTSRPTAMAVAFTVVFIVNTLIDLKVNIHAYMGEGAVAT